MIARQSEIDVTFTQLMFALCLVISIARCRGCSVMYKQRWYYYGKDWLEAKMIEEWNTRKPGGDNE